MLVTSNKRDVVDATREPRAALEWIDWFNDRRLHTELGDVPPTEHEANHYRHITASTTLETREPSLH